ncbi:MAG: hypothetical protein QM589_14320 [Thermomicrobiales bacterium]
MMRQPPIAHSARNGEQPQLYQLHIDGVLDRVRKSATDMMQYCRDPDLAARMQVILEDAASVHDLGKLDPENQDALHTGPHCRLPWDHVDAGVAVLMNHGAEGAAWLVRGHHAPGLPRKAEHFPSATTHFDSIPFRKLRGRRRPKNEADHWEQIAHTNAELTELVSCHERLCGSIRSTPIAVEAVHGLPMRLMQSCLVNADHGDTAASEALPARAPRWQERLEALDRYVEGLSQDRDDPRSARRRDYYRMCRQSDTDGEAMISCEGPVGIGKTTAVMAWLLRRAIKTDARRIIVVAPYTGILSQSARVLREALVLPDEQMMPDAVVAEHHHRADFSDPSSRELATLWEAPIVLTTSVQFFETLAANQPSRLRKLHALPGSVVFVDEAHATLPLALWEQNWKWLNALAAGWGCSFVFGSGSLVRFWTIERVIGDKTTTLPDLVPKDTARELHDAERRRIAYQSLGTMSLEGLKQSVDGSIGPHLLILNTLEGAAKTADYLRQAGSDVIHLSTALSPQDRERILQRVTSRLSDPKDQDWTLVATSIVEAGVDLSFRTGFRERFSVSSIVQTGGRVNRHGEHEVGIVFDFALRADVRVGSHPDAAVSGGILRRYLDTDRLSGAFDVATIVTEAIKQEARGRTNSDDEDMVLAETRHDYPKVAELGKVIQEDTRLVVIDPDVRSRLESGELVPSPELLAGSVQVRKAIIDRCGLQQLETRREVYWWHHLYEAEFLGYMRAVLDLDAEDRAPDLS